MIIKCPSCRKPISDKREVCPECGHSRNGSESPEVVDRNEERRYRKLRYTIQMQTYMAILITAIGVVWVYKSSDSFQFQASLVSMACLAAGAVWYVGLRIFMIIRKVR